MQKKEVIKFLEQKPEYLNVLMDLLNMHDKNPVFERYKQMCDSHPDIYKEENFKQSGPEGITSAWSQEDYFLSGGQINALRKVGILSGNLGSNKHKEYGLLCPEAVREAVNYIQYKKMVIREVQDSPIQIPEDLFAPIVGHEDVKRLCMMVLMAPKPVHMIMKGPFATAKSVFIMELERIAGSRSVEGTTSSKAGINDILLEEEPKILLIDEIGQLKAEERTILLELCGKGTASDTKHTRKDKKNLDTRVFGACNRLTGFTPEFISRFEIVEFSEYGFDEFITIGTNILTMREGMEPEISKYITEKVWNFDKQYRDIREVVRVARMCGDDKEQIDWLLDFKKENIRRGKRNGV